MNKKGSIPLIVLFAVIFFIFGMLMFSLIKPDVTRVRSATELNCTGIPSSSGDMITCIGIDSIIPYLILIILSVSGGYIVDNALK